MFTTEAYPRTSSVALNWVAKSESVVVAVTVRTTVCRSEPVPISTVRVSPADPGKATSVAVVYVVELDPTVMVAFLARVTFDRLYEPLVASLRATAVRMVSSLEVACLVRAPLLRVDIVTRDSLSPLSFTFNSSKASLVSP